jgi:hypothetical protein
MMSLRIFNLCALVLVLATTSFNRARGAESPDYNRDIRPILSDRCFACHGPDEEHREADLRLDMEDEAVSTAIDRSHPAQSELLARITSPDDTLRMPPADSGKSLSVKEIELLKQWIQAGAPYAPYWAYVPPRRHAIPASSSPSATANWIDRWIQFRLQKEGLAPAPPADPITLLRRVSFDLTGLPPSPEDVAAFSRDHTPASYEQLVERLLESPHFGERMAIFWLDLVRYADTVGYHGDQDHNISPYRDYVIEAFNQGMPFDRFTHEQLAGDLLPHPTLTQRVATGYNRMLQTTHEGGLQPKEYLAIYAADRVRNLSLVWMGGTMGCCQCHDHKYDPYTLRDFYSMEAFFADIDEAQHFKVGGNKLPTNRPPEIEVLTNDETARIVSLQDQIRKLESAPDSSAQNAESIARLKEELDAVHQNARKTMVTVAIEPRPIRVLPRGNWMDDSGDIVPPAVPAFLGTLDTAGRATRLDLAHWLTDPVDGVGGLTARVMVNRFWALLLGSGLSKSLDDFGGQGEPPVHPELLDQLAVEFYESGWDIKHLLRLIVLSDTYRQSSQADPSLREKDPENRLFARQATFRLPAEMIRDNALAISGLLVEGYGGASVRPYQPEGYYRHLNFPKRVYHPHHDSRQWRRGVYVHWQRQYLHPMLKAFDAPSREECTAQRSRSNTPLAALVLLNDPTFIEAARGLAARALLSPATDDAERIDFAFHLALCHAPDDFERQVLLGLLEPARSRYRTDPAAAQQLIAIGDAPVGRALDPVELAAWMQVTRAILNLNETITRN